MADQSPAYLRGFLIPRKLTTDNIWAAQSSYTEQDNYAGDPEPQQSNSRLIVKSTGRQNINSNISIITRRAGHVSNGAAFTFKNNATSDEFGLDAPNAISNFEVAALYTGSGLFQTTYKYPYPLDMNDGSLLIVVQSSGGGVNRSIEYRKRTDTGVYTSGAIKNILTPSATLTQDNLPVLVRLDDDSILCMYLIEDVYNELVNVEVQRSTDDGVTWSRISRAALDTPISVNASTGYTCKRLRVAQINGQILLLVETLYNDGSANYRNRLHQYASIDGGASFVRVTSDSRIDDHNFLSIDLSVRFGEFVFSYIAEATGAHYMTIPQAFFDIHILRSAAQYDTISTDTIATGGIASLAGGEHSLFVDESGDIFAFFKDVATNDNIFIRQSSNGLNWTYANGDSSRANAMVFNLDDTGTMITNFKVSRYAGRAVIASNWLSSSTTGHSTTLCFLGGWSNINLPVQSFGQSDGPNNRAGYDFTYFPLDLPANIGSIAITGAGTQTINGSELTVSTSSTQTIQYKIEDTTTIKMIVTGRIVLKCISGGDLRAPFANGVRKLRITSGNNTKSFDIEIRFTSTHFAVFDNNAVAQIGTDQTIAGGDGIEFLYSFGFDTGGQFACWYRQHNVNAERLFITGPSTTSLTDGGATSATQQVYFVHIAPTASVTIESRIGQWVNAFDTMAGGAKLTGLSGGFSTPYDLAAATYPPIGQFRFVGDNVRITTANGPAYEGDEYKIQTRFNHPISNVFYANSPTPRIQYRSGAVTSGAVPSQFFAFQLDSNSTASNVATDSDTIAFHLSNINFRQFTIEYYDTTAAAWAVKKTVNTAQNLEFLYGLAGNTIEGIDGSDEPYVFYNEFADCIVELSIGGTVERYTILHHTEGKCSTSSYRRPIFTLSGRPTGTGTARIVPKNVTVICNLNGITATAWGLRITSTNTMTNDFRIGSLCVGSVLYAGRQYSWGRSITLESNIESFEAPDFTTYSRKLSPPRRRVTVAWSEGVDISRLVGTNPTPDIITASTTAGAKPVASINDVPFLLFGVVDYLAGGVNPCIYLPSVKRATTAGEDSIVINRYHDHIMATIAPEFEISAVLGDEGISEGGEVFRVSNIDIIEVI
jgi:hypothetical protein